MGDGVGEGVGLGVGEGVGLGVPLGLGPTVPVGEFVGVGVLETPGLLDGDEDFFGVSVGLDPGVAEAIVVGFGVESMVGTTELSSESLGFMGVSGANSSLLIGGCSTPFLLLANGKAPVVLTKKTMPTKNTMVNTLIEII